MNPVARLVLWIVIYVAVMAAVQAIFNFIALPKDQGGMFGFKQALDYKIYVDILLSLFFGWQILTSSPP